MLRDRQGAGDPAFGARPRVGMRWLPGLTAVALALPLIAMSLIAVRPALAAELVMFEASYCGWCARWDEEVGGVYPKTSEGRAAPLRRVDLHAARPRDLAGIAGVRYTPTFVLLDGGREVGRIQGYPGEQRFWGLLDLQLRKMEDRQQPLKETGES